MKNFNPAGIERTRALGLKYQWLLLIRDGSKWVSVDIMIKIET